MASVLSDDEVFGKPGNGLLSDDDVFGSPSSDGGMINTIKQGVGDFGLKLNVGTTVAIPEQVVGINDLARKTTPLGMLSEAITPEFVKKARGGVEDASRKAIDTRRNDLSAEMSPAQQAADKKQYFTDDAAWSNIAKDGITAVPGKVADLASEGKLFGEGWGDWRKVVGAAVESLPGTIATMGPTAKIAGTAGKAAMEETLAKTGSAELAQAAATKSAERAAMISGGTAEGLQGAGGANEQTRRSVMEMPFDKLEKSPFFQAELKSNGGDVAAARTKAADAAATMSAGIAFLFDATLGGLGDKYIGSAAVGKGTRAGAVSRGTAQEMPTEFVQSGGEKFGENLGIREFADPSQNLSAGVGEEATAGGLSGGLTGGVMGAAFHRNSGVSAPPAAPVQLPDTGPLSRSANVALAMQAATPQSDTVEQKLGDDPAPVKSSTSAVPEQSASLVAPDRVTEIDTESERVAARIAELNDPAAGYGPAFDLERSDLQGHAAELASERETITRSWPAAKAGSKTSFSTESGSRISASYALMNAADLNTSHDESLKPSKSYPAELQPRERDRAASEMQISGIAQRLDPTRLGESADAATGAPIVGIDGLVESGNARSIALKRVYRDNPQAAEGYRQFLRDNAGRFGLDPADIDSMPNPVLVRVRETPVDRAEFARQANASTVAQMSSSEQARADAARLDSMDDLRPDDNGDFATSREFIRRFVSRLPGTERAAMIDANGQLSQSGYSRVRNAVLAKAYGESPVLTRMVESLDDNLRNVGKALMMTAPEVAKLRQDVEDGALYDADITADLLAAIEELSRLKDAGRSVREELAQAGMFDNGISTEARDLLQFLDENIRKPRKIAEFIQRYAEALRAAGNPNQGSLLGEAKAPTKQGIINAVWEQDKNGQATGRPGKHQGDKISGQENGGQRDGAPGDRGGARGNEAKTETPLSFAPAKVENSRGTKVPGFSAEFDNRKGGKGYIELAEDGDRIYPVMVDNGIFKLGESTGGAVSNIYEQAIQFAVQQGKQFTSDDSVTVAAARIYDGLARRGYHVVKNSSARLAVSPEVISDRWVTDDGAPVFSVQPKVKSKEWVAFPPESGTLGIPRANMPQVKSEHRGALIAFLKGQGIGYAMHDMAAGELKPTQAEFSTEKAAHWSEAENDADRSVLVSSDGYILDGHHQWVAALAVGDSVQAIQFDAPIKDLLLAVHQFPSAQRSEGAESNSKRDKAREDFKEALADLGSILRDYAHVARMVPEKTPDLMPTMARLFKAGIIEVGYNLNDLVTHVKKALKADAKTKAIWNKIDESIYRKAANQAVNDAFSGWKMSDNKADHVGKSTTDYLRSFGIHGGASEGQIDHYRNDIQWTGQGVDDRTGFPVWSSRHVALRNPRDVTEGHDIFYKPLGNERAVKYDIANSGDEVVGAVVLELEDGWPTLLLDIEVKDELRGNQYAERTVAAIANDAGQLGIWHIIPSARSWWERNGTVPVDEHNGSLTFHDYADARADRENSRGLAQGIGVSALSRGEGGGMAMRDLAAVVDRVSQNLKNLPKVHVLESPSMLSTKDPVQKSLRDFIRKAGAWEDAEGATHEGEIYLFASGLSDEARAEHVLAVHEVTHYGLRGAIGKRLDAALQEVWVANAKVRKAAAALKERNGLQSNIEATEEVLADMLPGDLAKLTGWRRVAKVIRDWLAQSGFERLAARVDSWMKAGMTDQEKADQIVADLVNAARDWVKNGKGEPYMDGTRLADRAALSQGIPQTDNRRTTGFDKASGTVVADFKNDSPLKAHADYKMAKAGNVESAIRLVRDLVKTESIQAASSFGDGVIYVPVHAEEASGRNKIPDALAAHYAANAGGQFGAGIMQANRAYHTGANAMERLLSRAEFSGKVEPGKRYVLVDDVTTMGSTLADLASYIRSQGGEVVGSVVLVNAARSGMMIAASKTIRELEERHGDELSNIFGIEPGALTASEAQYLLGFRSTDELRNRVAKARSERSARLLAKGISKSESASGSVNSRLSRATAQQSQQSTAAQRADEIISKPVGAWRPLDKVLRTLTTTTRIDRLTGAIYDRAAQLIDRYTPDQIKAGVVSDYGIPEAVIDHRTMMQGRMRVQLRKSGDLIDKLATLTRAESRVAYEWMNNADTQAAAYFEAQLPPESVKVMEEVKAMIDKLSQEAVDLGQLDPEAFKRNRFEYLRRSYIKHTAELTKAETAGRKRAIAILGDQYKGRGMSEAIDMAKFKNLAPEWWGRKLKEGQADKALKGEKFIRLERRAPIGDGVMELEPAAGPGETNPQKKGRLMEVAYWPAGEALPAKYSTWEQAGTWDVRDAKGGKLVVWRDFTKQERTAMGEIDEARYAIAKSLHGMIHDVETGRYLEWLGRTYGKKASDALDGELVEASERMRDVFKPGEWVQVPDTKIPGTSVLKYGKLAGKIIPGPVWNDVRQTVGFRFKPWGETYAAILGAWKTAKTALSPAVHTNNVMANFVMADWHDVGAGHILKALRIILGASQRKGNGFIGRAGNALSRSGIADAEAAREILTRYADSGANLGSWVTGELQHEQIEPLLSALEKELGTVGQSITGQIGVMVALQTALQSRFPTVWKKAIKPTGIAISTEAKSLIDLYEAEDQVFRLAAWLKAKEDGAGDLVAGKVARRSFLDYNINAPWIQAVRNTALPFISFTYRAVPMLLETAARKPHKLLKLGLVAGALNALGYMLAGGDEDDERKLLPEEKAGSIFGMVPKLIRMPWNDERGQPVFLDIRRFVPVGDIFDLGATHAAVPMLPFAMPGGPLALISELVANKSQFTGRAITLETDTAIEKATKVTDHLYKAFAPNIIVLPGTHAFSGVVDAGRGRTDAFGREQSVAQAAATGFGVKVGAYPRDALMMNAIRSRDAKITEIDRNISQIDREFQRKGIDMQEYVDQKQAQIAKKTRIMEDFQKKVAGK